MAGHAVVALLLDQLLAAVRAGREALGGALGILLLLGRHRRRRDEEVYLAALQLGVRGHDQDPPHDALRARLAQHVVRVGGQDLAGGHRAAVLLDAAVQVDDPDQVQRAAGEDAGEAAPEAVAHCFLRG